MFQNGKKYRLGIFVFLLLIVDIFLFNLDWRNSHHQFTLAMLDIGQGDAFFVESPTGTQVLIDGGPPGKILSQLARVMSPFDRQLDALIITNPDQDHIGGFLDVLKVYKVDRVFEPGTRNDSKTYQNLEDEIKRQNIPDILAKRGLRLDLGGEVVVDILFPDQDVSTWTANDGSVVARLSFKNISVMLTGDATIKTEKIILSENTQAQLASTVLKVGHHGSRTSTSESFLRAVAPSYALISAGKNNKYGHPHQDLLDSLSKFDLKIFRTDQSGTVVMKSDGAKVRFSSSR